MLLKRRQRRWQKFKFLLILINVKMTYQRGGPPLISAVIGHPKLSNAFGPWFKSKGSAKVLLEIETAISLGANICKWFSARSGFNLWCRRLNITHGSESQWPIGGAVGGARGGKVVGAGNLKKSCWGEQALVQPLHQQLCTSSRVHNLLHQSDVAPLSDHRRSSSIPPLIEQ